MNKYLLKTAAIAIIIFSFLYSNIVWALPYSASSYQKSFLSAKTEFGNRGFVTALISLGRIVSSIKTADKDFPAEYTKIRERLKGLFPEHTELKVDLKTKSLYFYSNLSEAGPSSNVFHIYPKNNSGKGPVFSTIKPIPSPIYTAEIDGFVIDIYKRDKLINGKLRLLRSDGGLTEDEASRLKKYLKENWNSLPESTRVLFLQILGGTGNWQEESATIAHSKTENAKNRNSELNEIKAALTNQKISTEKELDEISRDMGWHLFQRTPVSALYTSKSGKYFIKIFLNGDSSSDRFMREKLFYKRFSVTDRPRLYYANKRVPAIVLENLNTEGNSIISLYAYMHYHSISLYNLRSAVDSAALKLAELHRDIYNACGEFDGQGRFAPLDMNPFEREMAYWFMPKTKRLREKGYNLNFDYNNIKKKWVEKVSSDENVLNHGDFAVNNIFVDSITGNVEAVIDPESLAVTPRGNDVAVAIISLLDSVKNNPDILRYLAVLIKSFLNKYISASGMNKDLFLQNLPYYMGCQLVRMADRTDLRWHNRAWVEWKLHLAGELFKWDRFDADKFVSLITGEANAVKNDVLRNSIAIHGPPLENNAIVLDKGGTAEVRAEVDVPVGLDYPFMGIGINCQIWTNANGYERWHTEPMEFMWRERAETEDGRPVNRYYFKGSIPGMQVTIPGRPYEYTIKVSVDKGRNWQWINKAGKNYKIIVKPKTSPIRRKQWETALSQNYQGLIVDFDGVLANGHISQNVIKALAEKLISGIPVAVASGRKMDKMRFIIKILSGYLTNELGYSMAESKKILKRFILYSECGSGKLNAGTGKTYYKIMEKPLKQKIAGILSKSEFRDYIEPGSIMTNSAIVYFDVKEGVDMVFFSGIFNRYLTESISAIGKPLYAFYSIYKHGRFLIMPEGFTKKNAAEDFASNFGLDPLKVARIGDQGQKFGLDEDMLEKSGFTVHWDNGETYPLSTLDFGKSNVEAFLWLMHNLKFSGLGKPAGSLNLAIATPGMYTEEQHEKTNEKIRKDIGEGKYIKLQTSNIKLSRKRDRQNKPQIPNIEITKGDGIEMPEGLEKKWNQIWNMLDEETRQALEQVTIYLLPPDNPMYLYYLRTETIEGRLEYQVAHAGSYQGRGRFMYMTVQAFMDLPDKLLVKILKREMRLAAKKAVLRKSGNTQGLLKIGGYDDEAKGILFDMPKESVNKRFSYLERKEMLEGLSSKMNIIRGVVIIGGGCVGAGVARDAALNHLDTVLLEKGDFAEGTSSRSTKLIHAGIRYLELAWDDFIKGNFKSAWMNLRLVIYASRERAILQKVAPGLVKPIPLFIPVYKKDKRGMVMVFTGVIFYYLIALFTGRSIKRPQFLFNKKQAIKMFPDMNPDGLKGGFIYWDSVTDDQRLVMANIKDAYRKGAKTLSRVEVLRYRYVRDKHAYKITARDTLAGREFILYSRQIVDARGPWADNSLQTDEQGNELPDTDYLVRSGGIHIDVKGIGIEHSLLIMASDGRIFFVIPRKEDGITYVRIGTTERKGVNPETVWPTKDEIDYLCREFERVFPGRKIKPENIIWADAGVRPLYKVRSAKNLNAGAVSREHKIVIEKNGVIKALGVKLTDYRRASKEIVDKVLGNLGKKRVKNTDKLKLTAEELQGRPDNLQNIMETEMVLTLKDYFLRRGGFRRISREDEAGLKKAALRIKALLGWTDARFREEWNGLKKLRIRMQDTISGYQRKQPVYDDYSIEDLSNTDISALIGRILDRIEGNGDNRIAIDREKIKEMVNDILNILERKLNIRGLESVVIQSLDNKKAVLRIYKISPAFFPKVGKIGVNREALLALQKMGVDNDSLSLLIAMELFGVQIILPLVKSKDINLLRKTLYRFLVNKYNVNPFVLSSAYELLRGMGDLFTRLPLDISKAGFFSNLGQNCGSGESALIRAMRFTVKLINRREISRESRVIEKFTAHLNEFYHVYSNKYGLYPVDIMYVFYEPDLVLNLKLGSIKLLPVNGIAVLSREASRGGGFLNREMLTEEDKVLIKKIIMNGKKIDRQRYTAYIYEDNGLIYRMKIQDGIITEVRKIWPDEKFITGIIKGNVLEDGVSRDKLDRYIKLIRMSGMEYIYYPVKIFNILRENLKFRISEKDDFEEIEDIIILPRGVWEKDRNSGWGMKFIKEKKCWNGVQDENILNMLGLCLRNAQYREGDNWIYQQGRWAYIAIVRNGFVFRFSRIKAVKLNLWIKGISGYTSSFRIHNILNKYNKLKNNEKFVLPQEFEKDKEAIECILRGRNSDNKPLERKVFYNEEKKELHIWDGKRSSVILDSKGNFRGYEDRRRYRSYYKGRDLRQGYKDITEFAIDRTTAHPVLDINDSGIVPVIGKDTVIAPEDEFEKIHILLANEGVKTIVDLDSHRTTYYDENGQRVENKGLKNVINDKRQGISAYMPDRVRGTNTELYEFDHHFPDKCLQNQTAVSLVIAYLRSLSEKERKGTLHRLQNAVFVHSHLDSDNFIAQWVIRNWDKLNDKEIDMLSAVVFYSDHFLIPNKYAENKELREKIKLLSNMLYHWLENGAVKNLSFDSVFNSFGNIFQIILNAGLGALPQGVSGFYKKYLKDLAEFKKELEREQLTFKNGIAVLVSDKEINNLFLAELLKEKFGNNVKVVINAKKENTGYKVKLRLLGFSEGLNLYNVYGELNAREGRKIWFGRWNAGSCYRTGPSRLSIDEIISIVKLFIATPPPKGGGGSSTQEPPNLTANQSLKRIAKDAIKKAAKKLMPSAGQISVPVGSVMVWAGGALAPAQGASLISAMRADGIIDKRDFEAVKAAGDSVEEAFTVLGLTIGLDEKVKLTENIAAAYLLNRNGDDKHISILAKKEVEALRDVMNKIIYDKNQPVILALDTDIGPETQKGMLFPVYKALCEMRYEGLYIIRGGGAKLAEKINTLGKDVKPKNIIIICKQENIDKGCFKALPAEKTFIAGISSTGLSENNYIPLLKIAALALMIALGEKAEDITSLYKDITGKGLTEEQLGTIIQNRSLLILPKPMPIDIKRLRNTYSGMADEIRSSA